MRVIAILMLAATLCVSAYELETFAKWKYMDFHYPNEEFKQNFINWGYYNYSNISPSDMNMAPDGRIFVSMFGRNGSFIPLATISEHMGPSGPLLEPYPSWEFYGFTKDSYNSVIHSMTKVAFDKCNRMWFLDMGYYMDEPVPEYNRPKLFVFDLTNDKIIKTVELPKKLLYRDDKYIFSRIAYPVIETHGSKCEISYAYIGNMKDSSLIVYDDNANKFYNYEDPTFEPDFSYRVLSVADSQFEFKEGGLLGLTLVPAYDEYDSYFLYYRPLTSAGFYALNTSMLRERGIDEAKFFGARDYLQEPAFSQEYSPSEGVMFFGLTKSQAIGCWSRYNKNFELDYIAKNDERLQYIVGLHVYGKEMYDKEMMVLSKNFPDQYYFGDRYKFDGEVNFDNYNFYLLRAPVREMIEGTKCARSVYF